MQDVSYRERYKDLAELIISVTELVAKGEATNGEALVGLRLAAGEVLRLLKEEENGTEAKTARKDEEDVGAGRNTEAAQGNDDCAE